MSKSITDKIRSSEAFRSLKSELDVQCHFSELGWRTVHSPYIKDVETAKLREVDLVVRRHWSVGTGDESRYVHFIMPIESKCMRGYHILFAPTSAMSLGYRGCDMMSWTGWIDPGKQLMIGDVLAKSGATVDTIDAVLGSLSRCAYPDGTPRIKDLMIDPPNVIGVSGFRETNTDNQRDLETSVLWRSVLKLIGTIRSLEKQMLDELLEDLAMKVRLVRFNRDIGRETIIDSYRDSTRGITYYHPVVVTDAQLWLAAGETVTAIGQARLMVAGPYGITNSWCDVVNAEHLESYAQSLTTHVVSAFAGKADEQ